MENKSSNNTIQTFWVILGSLSAFVFTMVSSMLLSRYFTKADYGTYKQVMYVYGTLLVVFTLGIPRAYSYFLPRVSKEQAKDLISKLNYILLAMGLMMSTCLFFGSNFIAAVLKNKELITPIRYFSLVPLFMLPTLGLEGILATYKQTIFLAIYKTCTQIFMLWAVVLPVVFFEGNVNTAIIGFTISSFLCFLFALFLKYRPIKAYIKEKSPYSYKDVFKYTIPIMGASIWGIIISASDQFFISRYFGSEVFAEFANGSLELPFVGMLTAATATVLSPVFSQMSINQTVEVKVDIINLWNNSLIKTVKILFPILVFAFCFADEIMILLYGNKYVMSGSFFKIKLIVSLFTLSQYAPLLLSIGGQKFYYNIHMYGAIILVLLEWIGVYLVESPFTIIIISVICQIGRIMLMLKYIANYLGVNILKLYPLKLFIKIIIPSLVFLYVTKYIISEYTFLNSIKLLLISGVLYFLFYVFWAYLNKIEYRSIIQPLLKKI